MSKSKVKKPNKKEFFDYYGARNSFILGLDNYIESLIGKETFLQVRKSSILLDVVRVFTCACVTQKIFEAQLGNLHREINKKC